MHRLQCKRGKRKAGAESCATGLGAHASVGRVGANGSSFRRSSLTRSANTYPCSTYMTTTIAPSA